jgi:hypothetical protein
MKALFIAWQDPNSRSWYPVARLTYENGKYAFAYTRGARDAQALKSFRPFGRMTDLGTVYLSTKLFPLFANRVLNESRPEYPDYLRWLGLPLEAPNELEVLARSGGLRATDTLEVFPCPEPTQNREYVVYFFTRGIRHLVPENQKRIADLKIGDRLYLMKDVQNAFDPTAIMLRSGDPVANVGYCPQYFSQEFTRLLDVLGCDTVKVAVERVNLDAPTQFRLLCKLSAPWPRDFTPCSMDQFQLLSDTRKVLLDDTVTSK